MAELELFTAPHESKSSFGKSTLIPVVAGPPTCTMQQSSDGSKTLLLLYWEGASSV
jgi:hypothetical protein